MTETNKWILGITFALAACLYFLAPILSPFLVAMALAYLGDPLVDRMEEWGLSRTLSVSIGFLALFTVFVGLGLVLIPKLADQFRALAELGPLAMGKVETDVIPWLQQQVGIEFNVLDWRAMTSEIDWQSTSGLVTKTLARVTNSGLMLVAFFANLVLIPVVTFYLLRDWDILVEKVGSLVPRLYFQRVKVLAQECHEVLGAFIRGQLLVMFALGVIYSIGLSIVGLKLGLLIGMVAGLASIVPYMGFVVGIVAALIAAFVQYHDAMSLVWVVVVFGIGQMIEGMLLTPLLVGDRIGLHPVAVIFSILAGGQLFGFVGVLVGLPVAAVIMVLLRHIHDNYMGSEAYGQTQNLDQIEVPTDHDVSAESDA